MNVIIIEDELKTAKELQETLLLVDPKIEVVAILSSVAASVAWLQVNTHPELIFSDIQLGDGLSFEIFRQIPSSAPVIFCTAYDEYAIKSFEANGIDYILKPIDEVMIRRSLDKFLRLKEHLSSNNGRYATGINKMLAQMDGGYKKTLLVHVKEAIVPVKTSDINFAYTANGLVYLYASKERLYTVSYTIEQLELLLNPYQFFRANRKFIVNRETIQNIEHYFNRKLFIKTNVNVPEKIIVSKIRTSSFLRWMED